MKFSTQFVLKNFSFEIQQGDKISIVGRSGIGKTTLFRLLLGFEIPDAGTIFYKQKELDDKTVWELRRDVAYISQDLNIGDGKVGEFFNDTLSLKANIAKKTHMLGKLNGFLADFELPKDILDKKIDHLSGGEKQRVAIINALLLDRKIFLLDEISSALDQTLKSKVMDYFFFRAEFTVLSISHDNYSSKDVKILNLQEL
jgi:putative ABC transport system ATP-binding protein